MFSLSIKGHVHWILEMKGKLLGALVIYANRGTYGT